MTKQETWTVLKVLNWTKQYLAGKGIENARLESEWMLGFALGLDRVHLYVNHDKPLTEKELASFRAMVARRARREPLQYILGTQEFMGLEFEVSPAALIPRHDTEVLVSEAVKRVQKAKKVLDIGTGSGCVAVALARLLPSARVYAVEKSFDALRLALKNAARHEASVSMVAGSLFEPFAGCAFDLVVSNPPYIPSADYEELQPEVRDFEPKEALDGGDDGLDFYRQIIPSSPQYLVAGGWLIVEVGIGQAEGVREMLGSAGFSDCFTAKDPAGIERVVGGAFKGARHASPSVGFTGRAACARN